MTSKNPIIVEQKFNVPVDVVWKAITNVSEMRRWFFDNIPDFKPEVGFETSFNVSSGERNFLHQWKIIEVVTLKRIVYDWTYKEYPGSRGEVTFELQEDNGQTKLILTNLGLESFPQDLPEFQRESCIGGWNYFINQNLKQYLDS
ncbi:MAG: SRPBCC domain-containing protein [Bacteroidia bacterium]|nr:SRPBCC domain-containing protein [Bacteroidia bacterium]NND09610.1 SRPBCC domain-containing protein [Flavobacteriaceae bacterium]MBT8310532.1 SRPBCC domain-containing protein [Bacteroidia bacterium]NNK27327.1 SRPBCC domain-containing protein [Flavobacteriaceae bacterium]NNL61451.1 SRPBCC domain-containing protein [Flavobacteriaceae bacterium]